MNTTALRTLIVYAIILPLALFIGWITVDLANWDRTSFAVIVASLFFLSLPLLLKWHYAVLVLSWNTAITIFFVPGKPELWMLMAGITCGIAILQRIMQKKAAFLPAPSITLSLLALLAVIVITAKLKGGFGVQALGAATYGGRSFYYLVAAIVGYFALASQPIPLTRAKSYMAMFFLPGMVAAISTLIFYAGPSFYFLYLVFPVSFAGVQAMTEYSGFIVRWAGFPVAACAFSFYAMAVHGIRGVLQRWWLLVSLVVALGLGTMGGYRGFIVSLGLIVIVLFVTEGLLRSPIFATLLLIGGLAFAVLIPFSEKLPLSVQRSISFLPIKLDPIVRADAEASLEWRLTMWRILVPDLPKYIWLGKGYALNPTDIYLSEQAVFRGRARDYESSLMTGGYHSGPLSTYVPLGGPGALAVLAFLVASIRALYLNYLYGDEALKTINRWLFAYFLGQTVFFLFAYGSLSSDLFKFTGAIGLSIALNKGICRKSAPVQQAVRIRENLQLGPSTAAAR